MGTSTFLDILGSMIIGGLLLLVALRMNDQATANTFQSQEQLTVQQNITSLINNIESDFRKIGYCANPDAIPQNFNLIPYGNTTDIKFLVDLNKDGSVDTVEWYLGTTATSPNPNVRTLYRKVTYSNGTVYNYFSNLGVTLFTLRYFNSIDTTDSVNVPIIGTTTAKIIEVTLQVQPSFAYDTAYSSNVSVWRQTRLVSLNLIKR